MRTKKTTIYIFEVVANRRHPKNWSSKQCTPINPVGPYIACNSISQPFPVKLTTRH